MGGRPLVSQGQTYAAGVMILSALDSHRPSQLGQIQDTGPRSNRLPNHTVS